MFEMDKQAFGQFLAQRRREKGYTQKQLAEQLFVSDKAVSKWERGLSVPDVSLLLPLSQLLGVSVTELLEGRCLDAPMAPEEVETLIQKALQYPEEPPEARKVRQKKRLWAFLGGAALSAAELAAVYALFGASLPGGLWTLELLALVFGGYFWLGMPQYLPDYYDQNRIEHFAQSGLHLHIPGVCYNNRNWPYILRGLRLWSLAALALTPLLGGLLLALEAARPGLLLGGQLAALLLWLASLFGVVAVQGRRHEFDGQPRPERPASASRRWVLGLVLAALALPLLWAAFGGSARSASRVLYQESGGLHHWSASYQYLDGWMQRSLTPAAGAEGLQLTLHTEAGSLSVRVEGRGGEVLFDREALPDGSYHIPARGRVRVTVRAEAHRGSFAVQ